MPTRALAVVIVAVVLVYHVLRIMASRCTGGACEWYLPFSLLLPLIAILLAVLTAASAAYAARGRMEWSALLALSGLLASIGTIVAAMLLADNDTKVWVATLFLLTVPLTVFASAARRPTRIT